MITANNLAKYLIFLIKNQSRGIQPEEFDITPLKLQKLLYYCQGYSLALTGKPLFSDPIEAWKYGPVVNSVYQEYKHYQNQVIPISEAKKPDDIDDLVSSIAITVVGEKGGLSGIALAHATHKERPYKETYEGNYTNKIISEEIMRDFFSEEFLKWEEADDDDDEFWNSVGTPVTKEKLEAALAKI